MRRRTQSLLPIFMWAFFMTALNAQNGAFDVQFIVKNIACDSHKVTLAVQVRAHDMARSFLMGDANYRFEYDPRLLSSPKIESQERFSNLAPSNDFNYGPQNLNGSSVGPDLGVVSLNTFYTGVAGGARRVDTTWTTVSYLSFKVLNDVNCFSLRWHNNQTFPITGMNEVELLSENNYNLYVVAAGGVFRDLQLCFQNSCAFSPTVSVTPIVSTQDSTVTLCLPIIDLDTASVFTASICGVPKHGTATPSVSGSQLCVQYVPMANFMGLDSVCIRVCDNTNNCTDVNIPITVNPKPNPPTVAPTSIATKQDSTVTVCTLISDPDTNSVFTATICSAPIGGTASVLVVGNQLCIRFVPNGTSVGQTSLCVRVCDDTNLCVETTVPIRIDRRPTSPFIEGINSILTKEDSTATLCMPIGDLTPNAPYTASICGQPSNGTAGVIINNTSVCLTYTPNLGYAGNDQVCVRVCEIGTGLCSDTTIIPINVVAKPHAPVVTVRPIETKRDSAKTLCMPISDVDTGSTFTATLCNVPLHGTATPSVSGNQLCVLFVPTPRYAGTDNVCVRVCDNTGLCTVVNVPVLIDSTEYRNGLFDVRTRVKEIVCDSTKATIAIEVRAKTMANAFLMGDGNYRFKYDPRQIRNPRLITQANFSNIAPSIDFNYGTQNLNGSSAGTTSGLVSLNTFYTGVNQTAKRVDTAWITVSCIQFEIVDMAQCFDIKWNDGQTFPITGMSEIIVTNPNPFDYNAFVVQSGSFLNLNACPRAACPTVINQKPIASIGQQTIKEDSSFRVCVPVVDPNVDNIHTVTVCQPPLHGSLTNGINNAAHQLCVNYQPNNNYSGLDTVCLLVCDNGIPSLCDTVVVPIIVTPAPDPPSVLVSTLTITKDSTVKKCYPIVDPDLTDAFKARVCGVQRGQVGAVSVMDRTVCMTYTAPSNYVGTDTVCLLVCDSFGLCHEARIPIFISDCNDNASPHINCPTPMRVNIYGDILLDQSRFLQSARLSDTCLTTRLVFGMPPATDDCSLFSVSQKSGLPTGSNFGIGVHNLVFEAVDRRGKTTACSAQIEVVPARLISSVSADSVALCMGTSASFSTRDLGLVSYLWQGPNGFSSTNRQVVLSNLTPAATGKYRIKVTRNFCVYEDSLNLTVIGKPNLAADVYQMASGQTTLSAPSVLLNDTLLRGVNYTIKLKSGVSVGSLSLNTDGTFSFVPPFDFRGTATFVYEICYTDCPTACQTITANIKSFSNQRVSGNATNVITPNGDGVNDVLTIENYDPKVDTQSQIVIYNQWGDIVYRASPYLNDWGGTYDKKTLPDGTYYFIFSKSPDTEPMKEFVTIIR